MSASPKRSSFIVPSVDAARVDAQWERISRGLPAQRLVGQRLFGPGRGAAGPRVALALCALCALGTVWWVRTPRGALKQGVDHGWAGSLVASDDAPMSFKLTEGTHIDVDPNSQLELLSNSDEAVTMALARGAAYFDVAKRPQRRFSVHLGATEVVVRGTQFHVSRRGTPEGERMRVAVEEGTVEVHREGQAVVTLHRGDHWSGIERGDDFRLRQADDVADTREPSQDATPDDADDVSRDDINDDTNDESSDGVRRRRRAHADHAEPASELFEQANELRRAGELREAAKLFAQLVQNHPKDRRAALSAFELGRLRMDSLDDVRGAVAALEQALKLDAKRSFAEDALARLVTAHEALKSREACFRARERYLSRYPDGVHARRLAKSCAELQ